MKKRWWIVFTIGLVVMLFLSMSFVNVNPFGSNIKFSTKIEIRNGTNGELYVLNKEKATELTQSLLELDAKLKGIDIWSSGYAYKVRVMTKNESAEIVIKSENVFVKGILKYESHENIQNMVESAITE